MHRIDFRSRTVWLAVLVVLAALAVGLVAGWYGRTYLTPPTFQSVREISPENELIAPFLYLNVPESTQLSYLGLKSDIARVVNDVQSSGKVSDISVYVRDMNSGQWIAVNRDHKFALASMLKVVTAITVLHSLETNPGTLASHITLAPGSQKKQTAQAYYPPEHPVVFGQSYSIQDMLWHDLVESDNTAEDALESYVGVDAIKQSYDNLNLPLPPDTVSDADTAQDYSHLFRVLYGATYLSHENSQALLDLLTRTTYTAGLVAGVPHGTIVAHKFGENLVPVGDATSTNGTVLVAPELHDCGIVYYPKHPYFICVTTKGDNFDTLAGVIQDISATTWKGIAKINEK